MHYNRKQSEGALRFAERRKREDESPRLATEVPALRTLALEIEERTEGGPVAQPMHVRRIVVEHAPSLFLVPCGDTRCKDGGHDVSRNVLAALRAGETRFEGEDTCNGSVGNGACTRILHYVGIATYG